jgi:opacity protein-like surface antigen
MKLRTIFILVAMMVVVLATSAFGVYKDSEVNDEPVKHHKTETKAAADNTVVGASGAGTSHKHSKSHLDVSEKADGPYIKDGTNTYRGTASGYDLQGDSDTEDGNENDSDSENQSEFQKKWKYISTMFEEIFSKWKSQETIMAPTGIEEIETAEGFRIREKFKKGARQGMRKLKNAFRGRF